MSLKLKQKKLIIFFLSITLLLVLTSNDASAYTCTWTGTSSTAWATTGNWSGCNSTIPQTTDDVVINVASANQPILDLTGGITINSLSIGSSATSTLTLSNGLVDINVNKLTITNNLTIGGSGTITSTANTTAQTHSVNMSVGGNVDIASGGKIDVTGKGLTGGAGGATTPTAGSPGNTPGAGGGGGGAVNGGGGGGGGYGGIGGLGTTTGAAGAEHGQSAIQSPIALGSGGGGGGGFSTVGITGLSGGGAIKLVITGNLFLDSEGYIKANGNSGGSLDFYLGGPGGGGSGGSVWIQSGAISGTGKIQTNGGNGGINTINGVKGGGGAGGRIAITGYSSDSSAKQSYGGTGYQIGSAGSIYTKSSSATYGDLTFNNNSQNSPAIRTITTSYGVLSFNNLTFSEGTVGFTNTGATLNIHGTFSSSASSTIDKTFINSGTINLDSSGTFTISATVNNTGTINANNITTLNVSSAITNTGSFSATSLQNFNVTGTTIEMNTSYVNDGNGNYTCTGTSRYVLPTTYSMNISSSGTVNHTANPAGATPTYCLNLSMANLTIDGTSKIDVSGKGLAGGAGGAIGFSGTAGNISSNGGGGGGAVGGGSGGGGGHGGSGGLGKTTGAAGAEHDSSYIQNPVALGSGGGGGGGGYSSSYVGLAGATGGGAIKLNISDSLVFLNSGGYIKANGNSGASIDYSLGGAGGGGSGGSIWISTGTIIGVGMIQSNGGNGGVSTYNGSTGGGGAGGRIAITGIGTAGFVKGAGFSMTPTATGGTGYASGGNGSIYYNAGGTQTSSVMDLAIARNFTSLTYNKTTNANSISTPSLTVDIRASNDNNTWTSWFTNISSGTDINGVSYFNGTAYRYVQYRLNLASNNGIESPKPYSKPTANPSLQDISFNYTAFLNKTLTSSIYDSNSDANLIAGISWDETLNPNTNIKFQIRTSADGSTNWSNFLGPDGTNSTYFDEIDSPTYCTKTNSIVTCTVEAIPSTFKDGSADRYYQYKAFLETTDGTATPTLNSVTITYVVNANPEIEASQTTAVPNDNKEVNISYNARDIDSETNTITPSFEYSLDGGSSWTSITSGCLEATDLDAKAVSSPATPPENTTYTTHTATWTPSCETGISTTTYETDAQIRVRADDGQAANRYGYGTTANFTLDTKPPVITNFDLDASTEPAEIDITVTENDSTNMQMKLAQGEDENTCLTALTATDYETYNATPTITPNQDPVTICLKLKDQYNNESNVSYTTSPETPTAFMVQDTTNTLTTPNEYRLFIAWKVSDDPNFLRYELYRRADDNPTFGDPIYSTTTKATNSYPDNDIVGDQLYHYKIKVVDNQNNQSFYSETIQAEANGIQDHGEGGGGINTSPPVIDNVQSQNIYTSQATITWNTDVPSNSTVGYYAVPPAEQCLTAPCSFTTEVGTDTMYDYNGTNHYGPHTVVLSNLTPDTDYYFQVKSTNTSGITGTNDNTDHLGYHFKTLPGPKITPGSVAISKTTNTSATINWLTDIASSSKVNYSINSDMSNAENFLGTNQDSTNHEVVITGLNQGTRYYFYVQSTHNGDTATDNNEYPTNSYYYFTTTQDLTAPTIDFDSNTDISKTDTTAKITFTTSEQATSTLEYGADTSYGTELTSDNLNTNQIFDLEDLTPNTTYHFKITATDENSNLNNNSNTDYSFTTNATGSGDGPTISDIIVSDIKYNSAVIKWVTDQVGNSLVDYGITEEYTESKGNASNESTTVHEVLLNGLNSVTTYYFQVTSRDADDNKTTDDNLGSGYTFTTTSPTTDTNGNGEGDQLTDIMAQIQDMIDNYYFTESEIQDALSGLYSISITSSGPSVDMTDTTATITWTTNRPAIGKIYYWQDTDNEDTATSQAENITEARTDHEIVIKNLNANTKYNYYAYSEGLLGTTTQSDNKSFSTGDTASLSGISITNLTLNSADISWTTTGSIDSSTLEYGESIKYGKSDKGKTSSNLHTVNLTNLKENTTYHLRVSATDSDGQTLYSDDYSFTTVSLPIISNIQIKDITTEGATINWQTNVKTDSRVEFKKEGETKGTTNGELEAVTDHSFTLTNLFPGTRYTFKVSSKDTFNNESSSEEQAFTTQEDLNAPIITNIKSDTTVFPGKEAQIQTIISWNTDKDSSSILAYREGVEKDPTLVDQLKNPDTTKVDNWKLIKKSDLTKNHLFVLTDLKPASVYQFRTASFDKHGNVSVSENYSLLTPAKQQSVLDLIISNFESTFGWVKKIGG